VRAATWSMRPTLSGPVPLYLREAHVKELLTPADAVEAVEGCFARLARGAVENRPRLRLGLREGLLHVMAAADLELGVAGVKTYAGFREGARFVVPLFAADRPELLALVEADRLGQLRTGAASAVAARHLARAGARTLGVIGTGWQAESQVDCIRAALPGIERVVAYSRNPERLADFCRRLDCEPGEYNRDAAEQDVVVTITTSRDPVLRGEWLRPGALVCAAGANRIESRELDNAVLERATFVCCDSREQAMIEADEFDAETMMVMFNELRARQIRAEAEGGDALSPEMRQFIEEAKAAGVTRCPIRDLEASMDKCPVDLRAVTPDQARAAVEQVLHPDRKV